MNDIDLDEVESSWEKKTLTIPNVVLDDAPLKELIIKAHAIMAGETHETLDALVCRLADAIPEGVTEDNFGVAKPLAGACKKWYGHVEKLRAGLKRPALDWGKAVDTAAKEWVARAEPTLDPIIDAVKKIDDRKKAEKLAAEEAERKRIADEVAAKQKAEQDAERVRIKAEQDAERAKVAAERKQLAELAEANRLASEKLAAERKEMDELKAWLAEREAKVAPKYDVKAVVDAESVKMIARPPAPTPDELQANIDKANREETERLASHQDWPPTLQPGFADPSLDIALTVPELVQVMEDFQKTESLPVQETDPLTWPPPAAKFTNDELQRIMLAAETSAEYSKAGVEVHESFDQQKVRDYGLAIKTAIDSLKRPLLVKHEARQAVELAVFDIYGVANSLQEWRMA